jgi:hypothetical protein
VGESHSSEGNTRGAGRSWDLLSPDGRAVTVVRDGEEWLVRVGDDQEHRSRTLVEALREGGSTDEHSPSRMRAVEGWIAHHAAEIQREAAALGP